MRRGKFLAVLGYTLMAAGLLYIGKREFDKAKNSLKSNESKDREALKSIGTSRERMEAEIIPIIDDGNLVKKAFVAVSSNPEWDMDVIKISKEDGDDDIPGCLDTEQVIHVLQHGRNIELLFEIPGSTRKGGYNSPKIGNYITEFNRVVKEVTKDIIKVTPNPRTKLVGYFVIKTEEKESGSVYTEYVEIPKELYQAFSSDKHDGLAEYIEWIEDGNVPSLNDLGLEEDEDYKFSLESVFLGYSVTYPIRVGGNPGIGLDTLVGSLKYMVESIKVTRTRQDSDGLTYDRVMFHALEDEKMNSGMTCYYTTNESGNVIQDEYTY